MTSELPRLIGLIGRKGSGKDTAAGTLLDQGYVNVKFAGALKGMIGSLLAYQGVDAATIERMTEGDLKEIPTEYLAGKTPRYAMQTLGTEWGRDLIGKDFWAAATIGRVKKLCKDGLSVVLTDTRFPNEVGAVEEAGGIPFGITADWIKPVEGEHESEALIDDLIAALPAQRKIVNRKAATAKYVVHAIQEFQTRFISMLSLA